MCLKPIITTFILIFCSFISCLANQKIETQIGLFNFAGPSIIESKFVSQFGKGFVQIDKAGDKILGKKYVYYAPQEKVWVQVKFSHVLDENLDRVMEAILVTKKKLCDERFKPRKLFGCLITSKGVRIGDSIDKVIEVYGTPTISFDIEKEKLFSVLVEDLKLKEGRLLRYLSDKPNELSFVEFYFSGRSLHSLLISESE